MTFDQASSVMARGDLSIAARDGHVIPPGVGVDADGAATTDPAAVLGGAMLPFGGYKGASIALLVELLAGPLLGEQLSVEAAEQDLADGGPARGGEFVLAIDPDRTSGGTDWRDHAERLFGELVGQAGVRLPGDRRRSRRRADDDAVVVPADARELLLPD
jgi:delta1-piperideine-2-carboxylate reductase